MAASDKKVHQYTNFNAGEYSPELAGRVDLESFGSSTRFMSNMLSQISGGVKKFYGTTHIAELQPESGRSVVKFVPFINVFEPMVLVFWGVDDPEHDTGDSIKVGLIYGDRYAALNITIPSIVNVNEMRWKQINDVIVFAHNTVQPFAIKFYGKDENDDYVFATENIAFDEVPYFPINTTEDYRGTLVASGLGGTITLTFPTAADGCQVNFPYPLSDQATYSRCYGSYDSGATYVTDPSVIRLIRRRNGTETVLATGTCNAKYTGF